MYLLNWPTGQFQCKAIHTIEIKALKRYPKIDSIWGLIQLAWQWHSKFENSWIFMITVLMRFESGMKKRKLPYLEYIYKSYLEAILMDQRPILDIWSFIVKSNFRYSNLIIGDPFRVKLLFCMMNVQRTVTFYLS